MQVLIILTIGCEHVDHLSGILNKLYKCSQDWNGARYLGMNIDWDYTNKHVHVSMLDYVLQFFTMVSTPEDCSHYNLKEYS